MQIEIEAARLKQAVDWLKGVGAEYVQVAKRGGKLKAMAAVFVCGEVVLVDGVGDEEVSVHLETAALQRFVSKLSGNPVTLDIAEHVRLLDGRTRATFQQPAAARNCQDIQPKGVKRIVLHPDNAALLAKYTARDGKFSFACVKDGRAYAHDRVAALALPAPFAGKGFLARRVLEKGTDESTQYYANAEGSFVREPDTGSVLFESHANDVTAWPVEIPGVFANMENFPVVFSCSAEQLRRALQQYGKLDVEQSIRIAGTYDQGTVTIHGTKTVIEGELTTEADGAFEAVMATATLVPFLNAAPDTMVRLRYEEGSPYLLTVDDMDALLLTPRGA